jgi:hypothetical protein
MPEQRVALQGGTGLAQQQVRPRPLGVGVSAER